MLSNRAVKSVKILENFDFASADEVVRVIDLGDYSCGEKRFALEIKGTAGTGNLDVVYTVSIDGVTYFAPTDTAIISDIQLTSKRANVEPFAPTFCKYLKFTVTEDGTEAITGVNATLIMQ